MKIWSRRDKVVVRFTAEGTHEGKLLGVPPTGKRLRVSGISIYRLAEGKVVEQWEEGDRLGLLQELGVIPAPAAPGCYRHVCMRPDRRISAALFDRVLVLR